MGTLIPRLCGLQVHTPLPGVWVSLFTHTFCRYLRNLHFMCIYAYLCCSLQLANACATSTPTHLRCGSPSVALQTAIRQRASAISPRQRRGAGGVTFGSVELGWTTALFLLQGLSPPIVNLHPFLLLFSLTIFQKSFSNL